MPIEMIIQLFLNEYCLTWFYNALYFLWILVCFANYRSTDHCNNMSLYHGVSRRFQCTKMLSVDYNIPGDNMSSFCCSVMGSYFKNGDDNTDSCNDPDKYMCHVLAVELLQSCTKPSIRFQLWTASTNPNVLAFNSGSEACCIWQYSLT